eukprot:2497339-Heterocapsa_arctica.AAC.1
MGRRSNSSLDPLWAGSPGGKVEPVVHQVVLEPDEIVLQLLVLCFPVHDRIRSLGLLKDQVALRLRKLLRQGLALADHLPVDVREHEDLWALTVDPRDKGARSDVQFRSERSTVVIACVTL